MLDLKFVRENAEAVKKGALDKGFPCDVDGIVRLDKERRERIQTVEELKARRNTVSQEIAGLKKQKKDAGSLIEEMKGVSDEIKVHDQALAELLEELNTLLLTVPNIPHETVPPGRTPAENIEIERWGDLPELDFDLKPHWELVERLDIIDFKRGVKVTGAGFPLYKGLGARLERALINFFLDTNGAHGYTEVAAPLLVNADSATGTGQLPDKEDLMYEVARDNLYLIPTAEVPVTNIHRDEILAESDLPVQYCGFTPCFRREAGSYGKDVRGLNRIHQFDKVELVKFVHPDTSYDELESLRKDAERLLQMLDLPYRVLLMCSGDMGFTQTKKYDLEVWSAGQERWLEVSSCSNFGDFQARRINVRFRPAAGGKPEFVHTLNGSGLALPRIVAALIENNQTDEGTIVVPEVLKNYLGTGTIKSENPPG